ncbi:thioredoxin family protein [Aureibacillus halotolerans]|uniref:Thioredoxin n=1 Tax=Aureibacillus halotolerans TaxID=1508390 RepID=A0A4R6U228_9BACI|nr:thioredoxin family protein [Aureibacillus halotolerans]TDQ40468.1 thioredoxin [Aureibacillus halotolerans]
MKEWDMNKLENVLAKSDNQASYIFVSTTMCGTCQLAEKILTIVMEVRPELMIGKINVNYHAQKAKEWKIESVPCLVKIENHQAVDKLYAFESVPKVVEFVQTP